MALCLVSAEDFATHFPPKVLPMIVLTPHDGDFGLSAWVDCARCQRHPSGRGWFAIRAGEPHFEDRRTHRSYHRDCAEALVQRGEARIDRTEAA